MDFEYELQRVADVYRSQGYDVTVRPVPGLLPPFAADFRVEIVGRRAADGVLVAVRKNRDALAADADVQRYAEVTGGQAGWRFDIVVLEGENPNARDIRGGRDLSGDEIAHSLEQAGELGRSGYAKFAVIAAWAGLEAAMRLRLRAAGREAGWGSKPREMLKELYSAGALTPEEFRNVEIASQLRNQIVHGFAPNPGGGENPAAAVEDQLSAVRVLSEVTSRLVSESQAAALPA
jgi:HEPN domain-containing protein